MNQGAQFGLINVNLGQTPRPDIEQKVLDEVGSYGRQLGRIGDALEVLIDHVPLDGLSQDEAGRARHPQGPARRGPQGQAARARRRRTGGMKATIWHNPNCGTSRKTLEILRESGADVTVVEYLKTPPSRDELRSASTSAPACRRREGLRRKEELAAADLAEGAATRRCSTP